jgi:hypothetical protein
VRLFQRKHKWISIENINYEKISSDLAPNFSELIEQEFLLDESAIASYEEALYMLKLPQLKELVKTCHISTMSQSVKLRSEFIKLILQHFKTQKGIMFNLKTKNSDHSTDSALLSNESIANTKFMQHCKRILGKCYKLCKQIKDVFVRILMLYSLTSTHHLDMSSQESGKQQL